MTRLLILTHIIDLHTISSVFLVFVNLLLTHSLTHSMVQDIL